MKISELIKKLQDMQDKEGDLNTCVSQPDEYWGSVDSHTTDYNVTVKRAQPDGPKSGKSELAVVFECL